MPEIKLTLSEILLAAQAGCMRQIENLKLKTEPSHSADNKNDWQYNINGALGECALAKYLGVYWPGKGKFKDFDVGNVDVRTNMNDDGDLILHKNDPDERKFWLVTGLNGKFFVRGWIYAKDGKKDKYWKAYVTRPAYFVPQKDLNTTTED